MQLELLYLIFGLIGLLIGSELVIRAVLNISRHYKISHLFLGLVILSIGTDLPELVVDVTGAIIYVIGKLITKITRAGAQKKNNPTQETMDSRIAVAPTEELTNLMVEMELSELVMLF